MVEVEKVTVEKFFISDAELHKLLAEQFLQALSVQLDIGGIARDSDKGGWVMVVKQPEGAPPE